MRRRRITAAVGRNPKTVIDTAGHGSFSLCPLLSLGIATGRRIRAKGTEWLRRAGKKFTSGIYSDAIWEGVPR